MRQLGRLIIKVQDIIEKTISLTELLTPENFDTIILGTKQLCISYQESTSRPKFQIPSLDLKLGYSLKKCVSLERGQALRHENLIKNKKLLAFLALLKLEWSVRISSNAVATLEARKLNSTDFLPLTSDLVKLRSYLDSSIHKIKNTTIKSINKKQWTDLASFTLVRIIMFNKRRSGEASKLTLQQYASRPSWDKQGTEEIKKSLSNFEQKLAPSLSLVEVVGKRGRRVPIILSEEAKEALDYLISKRVQAGVLCENPYMFAIPDTEGSHMRGHDCVKKCCTEAELQCPNLITGTKLRKYVATVCQLFDLTENEQDWLARHLGHDIRVHRQFYRLQENAVELTKISRILLAVDQGEVQSFAGNKLKDINIEDLPAMTTESDLKDLEPEVMDWEDETLDFGNEVSPKNTTLKGPEAKNGSKRENIGRKKSLRVPWSEEEKETVLTKTTYFIKNKNLPGKNKCCELIQENPTLNKRKWTDIKFYVKNYLSKITKKT